jgi:two-component system cell cycle sensor histidine kinase/response regulator CckA
MSMRSLPHGVRVGLLCVLYIATAKFGLSLDAVHGFAAAVWPPTGIALGALVLGGYRLWPGIALGAFLVNVSAGAPLLVAGGMALGNVLEAVVGAVLLTRVIRFRPSLDRLQDVMGLVVLAAGLSTVISATIGIASGWLGGVIPAATAWMAWRTWWMGDVLGDLVVAPILFVWSRRGRISLPPRRVAEAMAMLVCVSVLSLAVFGPPLIPPPVDISYLYLLFPVLIWAAVRLGPQGAVTATGLVSAIAIWGTVLGVGRFTGPTLHENLLALQAFMSIVAVTILILAAMTSERQEAEATRAQLAAIVDSSEDAIIGKTFEGRITSWNRGAERLYGYTAAEVLGQPIALFIPPDRPDEFPEMLARLLRGERLEHYETQRICKDGTRLDISLTMSPIHDGAGRMIGVSAISRDITAQKHLKDALKAATHHLHLVTDAMAAPVAQCSRDLRYLWVSRAYAAWLGRAPDTIVGRPIYDILGPEAFAALCPYVERVLAGEVVQYEEQVTVAGMGPRWITAAYTPTLDATGRPDGWVAVVIDMTDRKQTEEALQQAHKLQAIGTLAGGIAHEFNNILGVILGFADLTQSKVPRDSRVWENLQHILVAGRRAKDVVQQILTFSRQTQSARLPLCLQLPVQETLRLLQVSLPATIELRHFYAGDIGTVLGDATQLHQVVMNLCVNAEQAMRATGGVLEVRLEAVEVDPALAAHHAGLRTGPYVRLTVRDTGPGIPPHLTERIFEPFFTTKEVGGGTGMGLAIVHGIVTSHGGVLTVESELGHGSIFRVYLPRIEAEPPPEGCSEEAVIQGSERILFIDDEEQLVLAARGMLTHLGYQAEGVTSSHAALDAFRATPQRFDLVITDQTMPDMTGEALIRELRRRRPEIPVILCTGFSHVIDATRAQEIGIDAFLMKPLRSRDLAVTIRQVFAQRRVTS